MSTTEHPPRGLFITFEGPDGSGKSTQMRMLAERLRAAGYAVLETGRAGRDADRDADPADSARSAKSASCRATTELLLMFAARAQNVEQWILPALADGKIVLSDRFTDSTLVYQGAARGLGAEVVKTVDRIACHGLVPDLTLCIDIDTDAGLARAHAPQPRSARGHEESRLDEQASNFTSGRGRPIINWPRPSRTREADRRRIIPRPRPRGGRWSSR